MKIIKKGIPQTSGFYFVKQGFVIYWQCLVELNGFAPFLQVGKINPLFNDKDVNIIFGNLNDLDWSEIIEVSDIDQNSFDTEYINMMRDGAKLAAVKLLKERSGWGLKEAKEYCDELQAKYNV